MLEDKLKEKTKERVQFDFSLDAIKRLDELKDTIDAPTRADVIRAALRLYEWVVDNSDERSSIIIQNSDDKTIDRVPAKFIGVTKRRSHAADELQRSIS